MKVCQMVDKGSGEKQRASSIYEVVVLRAQWEKGSLRRLLSQH